MGAPYSGAGEMDRIFCSNWDDARVAIDLLAVENSDLSSKTVENVRIFRQFAAERYQAPDEIGPGYWPTMRLTWSHSSPSVEVEVFDDRYEFYLFAGEAVEIRHVAAVADTFPEDLKQLLDEAIPMPAFVVIES